MSGNLIVSTSWQNEMIQLLQTQLGDTRNQLKIAQSEIFKLQTRLIQREKEIEDTWKVKIKNLTTTTRELNDKIDDLTTNVEKLQSINNLSISQNEDLRCTNFDVKTTNEDLLINNKLFVNKHTQLREELDIVKDELKIYKEKLCEWIFDIKNKNLDDRLCALEEELLILKNRNTKIDVLEKENTDLKHEVKVLKNKNILNLN